MAGGGGKGKKRVARHRPCPQLALAMTEAVAAFGGDRVYLERFVATCRHIKVQTISQSTSVLHAGARDCSLQRRYQELVEEVPAPHLPLICAKGCRTPSPMPAALCTAAFAFNDQGQPVTEAVGAFVITQPMLSTLLFFRGDCDFTRCAIRCLETFPAFGTTEDRAIFNAHGGGCIPERSGATLSRRGFVSNCGSMVSLRAKVCWGAWPNQSQPTAVPFTLCRHRLPASRAMRSFRWRGSARVSWPTMNSQT